MGKEIWAIFQSAGLLRHPFVRCRDCDCVAESGASNDLPPRGRKPA